MEDFSVGMIVGLIIGLFAGLTIVTIIYEADSPLLKINQETADDLCIHLIGNESVIAKDWWDYNSGKEPIDKGQIVCELPSYDATHNIVIKTNN